MEPDPRKRQYEITWPNVVRVEHTFRPQLSLDVAALAPLELDAFNTPTLAEIAPLIGGQTSGCAR